MVLYISIISILVIALTIIDVIFKFVSFSAITTLGLIVGATLIEFALDGLVALIIHIIPNKNFKLEGKFYLTSDKERKFYEKIKIRKWKDKVWELGGLGGFSKKNLKSSNDINYLKQFIIESNKGVITHIVSCFVGFLIILFYLPFNCILPISLPIAIINILLNLPSLFILRYNIPKLIAVYKRNLRNKDNKNDDISTNNKIKYDTQNTEIENLDSNKNKMTN